MSLREVRSQSKQLSPKFRNIGIFRELQLARAETSIGISAGTGRPKL